MSIAGHKSISLIHNIQSIDLPHWAENRLLEYTQSFIDLYTATNPWLQWRMPALKLVGVKAKPEDAVVVWKRYNAHVGFGGQRRGRALAKEWKEMAVEREEEGVRDLYTRVNINEALRRAGVGTNGCRKVPDFGMLSG